MIEGSAGSSIGGKLRYGMVGGGPGAFIGDVHRKSIALDGLAEIAAGSFSRSYDKTLLLGKNLGIPENGLYKNYEEMAAAEGKKSDKIDFVVIVTPNVDHYPAARAFLNQGIHVVCDKPLCFEEAEAKELAELAKKNKLLFGVTYTYTGFPAVKHAREMIRQGDIGDIIYVNAEYAQDWLVTAQEKEGNRQAEWRTNPKITGKSNCVGDIGTHVENMVSYVTGLEIKSICARLDKIGAGRILDTNATIMLEYTSGAKGLYWMSQIAQGCDNGLWFRVFGTKGSLEWRVEDPNYLKVYLLGKPAATLSRGRDSFYPRAQSLSRIPSGHAEGYFEAMANIYKTYCTALLKQKSGLPLNEDDFDFPNAQDGLKGVAFIDKCVESSQKGAVWINY
jgi:predicted dehydrogenase